MKTGKPWSLLDDMNVMGYRTWTFIDGPSLKSTPELKDQVWTLFEANMHDIYIQANDPDIPWDPVQKRKELDHKKTRLVLVRTPNSESLDAFCSFRFEAEHDESGDMRFLVYIYEIQVAHGRRGAGIFRRMLTALEGMCVELGVQVIMLTCFKCNTQALPVYTHLGFKEVDDESETSQEFWKPVSGKCHYISIMSK
ncbi:GNAT family acetyltransferase, partial [Rhizoctonia solani AG-3 Rhs1AP]